MPKIIILFFVVVVFLSHFSFARADVVINEIMYAPSEGADYEWVEIYNDGGVAVDLTGWRFFHGETNSGPLTLRNGSSAVLEAGEYAIIAKSPSVVADYAWLNFPGMILSASTISLPDSGDNTYIAVASDTEKTISDFVTYDTSLGGSKDSGNSLSKISDTWTASTPTPGEENESSGEENSDNDSGGDTSSGDDEQSFTTSSQKSNTTTTTKTTVTSKIKAQITSKLLTYVGIPFVLEGKAFGKSGEQLFRGKYFWNFGDGDFREIKVIGTDKFSHTYFYPGDYAVILEYYADQFSNVPDASQKITIKTIAPEISISNVGDEQDFFVELSNNTGYEADLSQWVLLSNTKSFIIPRNTTISSKKKIIISSKITHFSPVDKSTLRLTTPEGNVIFAYGYIAPVVAIKPKKQNTQPPAQVAVFIPEESIPAQNLEASVIESDAVEDNSLRSYFLTTILTVFLGLSAGAVYFIRRKRNVSQFGDDFRILNE